MNVANRPAHCELEIESGSCEAYVPKFGFDKSSGKCKEFIYGGCEGNANHFESKLECEITCQDFSGIGG